MRLTAPNRFYVQAGIEKVELRYDDEQDFRSIENSSGVLDQDLAQKTGSVFNLEILNEEHGLVYEHKLGLEYMGV